jgi:tRNA (cytidine/uridine-2'-O-)-methyltransferase
MLNIVLVEPYQIPEYWPPVCGTESRLHLVHPFGFVINDKI